MGTRRTLAADPVRQGPPWARTPLLRSTASGRRFDVRSPRARSTPRAATRRLAAGARFRGTATTIGAGASRGDLISGTVTAVAIQGHSDDTNLGGARFDVRLENGQSLSAMLGASGTTLVDLPGVGRSSPLGRLWIAAARLSTRLERHVEASSLTSNATAAGWGRTVASRSRCRQRCPRPGLGTIERDLELPYLAHALILTWDPDRFRSFRERRIRARARGPGPPRRRGRCTSWPRAPGWG
jgi:hypothetical protein